MSVPKVSAESLQHLSKGVDNSRSTHFLAIHLITDPPSFPIVSIETIGNEGGSVIK